MEFEPIIYWFILILLTPNFPPQWVSGEPMVPCFFIFGDSLIDNGNNNFLNTTAKANYWPHGIDFRYGPTGRFTNGRTTVDIIAELLGFDNYIPPFASSIGRDILKGVNYASAGAGIRNDSGKFFGDRINFNQQLTNFKTTVSQIADMLGGNDIATDYLSKCLYHVGMGNNDFLCNYFVPEYFSTSSEYTINQYIDILINQYSNQLWILHENGARKIVLEALGKGGCMPFQLARNNSDGITCAQDINDAMKLFNKKLKKLVYELNQNLNDAKFIYSDTSRVFQDILDNPSAFGFKETRSACCGIGKNNAQISCPPYHIPCPNRTEYLFWDSYHPTEAANLIIVNKTFTARILSQYAYPFGIHHLAKL